MGNLHCTMKEISWRGFVVFYNREECEHIPLLQMAFLFSLEHTHVQGLLQLIQPFGGIFRGDVTAWLDWKYQWNLWIKDKVPAWALRCKVTSPSSQGYYTFVSFSCSPVGCLTIMWLVWLLSNSEKKQIWNSWSGAAGTNFFIPGGNVPRQAYVDGDRKVAVIQLKSLNSILESKQLICKDEHEWTSR